jgi:hypothetical protein
MKIYTRTRKNRAGKELLPRLCYEDSSTGLKYTFEDGELYKVDYINFRELPFTLELIYKH